MSSLQMQYKLGCQQHSLKEFGKLGSPIRETYSNRLKLSRISKVVLIDVLETKEKHKIGNSNTELNILRIVFDSKLEATKKDLRMRKYSIIG